jgi:septum formation protein
LRNLNPGHRFILASASPRRRDLLLEHGYAFEIIPADVDEIAHPHFTPEEIVLDNARMKARAIAMQHPDARVLGVDTIVAFEGEIFGKPADMSAAFAMLNRLNGRTHEVFSGVCLVENGGGREETFTEVTHVQFHHRTDEELRSYLARIGPLDKAGAYAAQDDKGEMIAHFEGSFSNVIGLPMEKLNEMLRGPR